MEVKMFSFKRAHVEEWCKNEIPSPSDSTVERYYICNYLMNVILFDEEKQHLIAQRIGVSLKDIELCCTEFPIGDGRPDLLIRTKRHLVVIELKDNWKASALKGEGVEQVLKYAERAKTHPWVKGREIVSVLAWAYIPDDDAPFDHKHDLF